MNKLLLAGTLSLACLATTACETLRGADGVEAQTVGVGLAEAAARNRCPSDSIDVALLIGPRLAFDATVGGRLSPAQRDRVAAARRETDRVCGTAAAAIPVG